MLRIRDYVPGEEALLREVFHSSVRDLARDHYSPAQLAAWAPESDDRQQWAERIGALRPFVAELDGAIAGYADLQASGYIDHFFVAARFARRGVGAALMRSVRGESLANARMHKPL